MAEYAYIQNYSQNGKLGINLNVFEQIVKNVTNKINGVSTAKEAKSMFTFHKPVQCSYVNGKVNISISVIIAQDCNVDDVCSRIQEEVAESMAQMVEMVPFQIKIKVAGIE